MAYEYGVRIAKSVALKCAVEMCKTIKNMTQDTAEAVVDYFCDKYFQWLIDEDGNAALSQFSEEKTRF